jgi:hypothetical protein
MGTLNIVITIQVSPYSQSRKLNIGTAGDQKTERQ